MFKENLISVVFMIIILFSNYTFAGDVVEEIKEKPILLEEKKVSTAIPEKKEVEPHYFTPFQFSFFAPLQLFPSYFRVYGVKVNIPYGLNKSIGGIDVGFANSSENLYGIGCAAFLSKRSGDMYGINISGIFNLSQGSDNGLSFAGFFNEVDTINGVQAATLCSRAKKVNGIQFGLLNTTHKMNGIQIGLLNYCKDQPFRYTLLFNLWDSGNDKEKESE